MERYARGPNFIYAKEWVEKKFGSQAWGQAIAQLAPEHAAVWNGNLMAIGTYPFESFKAIIPALARATGGQSNSVLAEMYSYTADQSLNQLYKVFFRVTSPGFVISNYPQLWKKFFTTGTVTASDVSSHSALLTFVLPETFLDWLEPACLGFSTRAVQLAGAKQLNQRVLGQKRLPDGQYEVKISLTWR